MAIPISLSLSPSRLPLQSRLFYGQQCLRNGCSPLRESRRICPSHSTRARMSLSSKPDKFKLRANVVKDWLLEAVSKFGKDFKWRKALTWSVVAFFTLDFVSAVLYAISRNQELVIPVGLLSGCLLADLLKEIAQQLLQDAKEKGTEWIFLGLTCLFALVSLSSAYFGLQTRVFLSHFGHGGLVQVFWMWRNSSNVESGENPPSIPCSAAAQEN